MQHGRCKAGGAKRQRTIGRRRPCASLRIKQRNKAGREAPMACADQAMAADGHGSIPADAPTGAKRFLLLD